MGLDPSVFFQGAAMRQANDARTQQIIGNIFNAFMASKQQQAEAERKRATDYEGAYMRVLTAVNQGKEPDPRDVPMAQSYGQILESKRAINPQTGETYQQNIDPLSGRLSVKPVGGIRGIIPEMGNSPTQYKSQFSPILTEEDVLRKSPMPPPVKGDGAVNDLGFEILPLGSNYDEVSKVTPEQRDMARGVTPPSGASPKTIQAAQEANIDIQKEKAGIETEAMKSAAKKSAEMTQENRVNQEQRKKGLSDLREMINGLKILAEETPSGVIEGAVATGTEMLGKSNKQAQARARWESGAAITGLNSRIAFLKGQGTITDKEAETAMAFIPKPNDDVEVKKQKLSEAQRYLEMLISGETKEDPITQELRRRGLIQ